MDSAPRVLQEIRSADHRHPVDAGYRRQPQTGVAEGRILVPRKVPLHTRLSGEADLVLRYVQNRIRHGRHLGQHGLDASHDQGRSPRHAADFTQRHAGVGTISGIASRRSKATRTRRRWCAIHPLPPRSLAPRATPGPDMQNSSFASPALRLCHSNPSTTTQGRPLGQTPKTLKLSKHVAAQRRPRCASLGGEVERDAATELVDGPPRSTRCAWRREPVSTRRTAAGLSMSRANLSPHPSLCSPLVGGSSPSQEGYGLGWGRRESRRPREEPQCPATSSTTT